jgi:hypothetical protein
MSMFGYNTLGFGSIAGTAPITLNFATHGSVSGTSATINIGTARSTRMVHLVGKGSTGSNVTINGSNMALSSSNNIVWFAYAKVPTGTTASIAWSNSAIVYVTTFDTVNSGAADSGTGSFDTTYTFLANEGVCYWGGTVGSGSVNPPTDIALSTNNSGGVNYLFQEPPNGSASNSEAAYSTTSSGANQTFTCTYSGTVKGGSPNLAQIFYVN